MFEQKQISLRISQSLYNDIAKIAKEDKRSINSKMVSMLFGIHKKERLPVKEQHLISVIIIGKDYRNLQYAFADLDTHTISAAFASIDEYLQCMGNYCPDVILADVDADINKLLFMGRQNCVLAFYSDNWSCENVHRAACTHAKGCLSLSEIKKMPSILKNLNAGHVVLCQATLRTIMHLLRSKN